MIISTIAVADMYAVIMDTDTAVSSYEYHSDMITGTFTVILCSPISLPAYSKLICRTRSFEYARSEKHAASCTGCSRYICVTYMHAVSMAQACSDAYA